MKKHITAKDIAQLSESQKQNLNQLWLPEKYDTALAYICKNAETEEFDEIEFVVGKVLVYHNHIILYDIKHQNLEGNLEDQDEMESETLHEEQSEETNSEESSYDESEEIDEDIEDVDFGYERPTTFSKEDCIPLLNIGQMIEILERSGYKNCEFSLFVTDGETGCDMGTSSLNSSGNDYNPAELCDSLWDCIKKLI